MMPEAYAMTAAFQPPADKLARAPLLERMTFLALLIGLVAAASYATGAAANIRFAKPQLGAWLEAHQFYLMEGGATAFGLIVGIRLGRRLAADTARAPQTANIAIILAALAFAPMIHLCARTARLGWAGRGGAVSSWIVEHEGYEGGTRFYRLFITAVYFFKTAGFAAVAGLALIALAVAIVSSRAAPPAVQPPA
jgi:hypothetical protein